MTGALHVFVTAAFILALMKSRMKTFWYWLIQVHLENDR